jgi:hypothetical protein
MEQKPGRYWGVIGRQNLPLGKREDREVTASQAVNLLPPLKLRRTRRRVMRRYRLANSPPEKRKYLRKSQLWSQDFTAKLFCNVEFWIERPPKLVGPLENIEIMSQNSGLDHVTRKRTCKSAEQAENHKKGPRRLWSRNHMELVK